MEHCACQRGGGLQCSLIVGTAFLFLLAAAIGAIAVVATIAAVRLGLVDANSIHSLVRARLT